MKPSNEWTEWHLTPQGWERGTEKTDLFRDTSKATGGALRSSASPIMSASKSQKLDVVEGLANPRGRNHPWYSRIELTYTDLRSGAPVAHQ